MLVPVKNTGVDAMVFLHFDQEPASLSGSKSDPKLVVRVSRNNGPVSHYTLSKGTTPQTSLSKVPIGHYVDHGSQEDYILFKVDNSIGAIVEKTQIMVHAVPAALKPPVLKLNHLNNSTVSVRSPLACDALDGNVLDRTWENLSHCATPASPFAASPVVAVGA